MDEKPDRLYDLLPAVYRLRDADQGYPLKALLRVIAEQVNVVEDDIARLYDNWFIETAQDWLLPYIGDLVGYRPAHQAGEPADASTAEGRALNKILIPRRDVAKTIGYRRRKGTLALLETLANDVAGWPARAVEFLPAAGLDAEHQPSAACTRPHSGPAPGRCARSVGWALRRAGAHRGCAHGSARATRPAATTSPASGCSSGG